MKEFGKAIPLDDAGYPFIWDLEDDEDSFLLPERALAK